MMDDIEDLNLSGIDEAHVDSEPSSELCDVFNWSITGGVSVVGV